MPKHLPCCVQVSRFVNAWLASKFIDWYSYLEDVCGSLGAMAALLSQGMAQLNLTKQSVVRMLRSAAMYGKNNSAYHARLAAVLTRFQ